MKLTPVDFDPFAEAPGTANQPAAPAQATKPKLTAVDYDPFDPSTQRAPKAPKPTQPGIAARLRSMLPRDTATPAPKRAPVTIDATPVPPQVDTDRTIGQVAGDIGNKVVGGAGALASNLGDVYGLATGDTENSWSKGGRALREGAEARVTPELKAMEAQRKAKVDAADGTLDKGLTAFWETIKSPSLLSSFLAEQAPMLIPSAAVGRGIATGARVAGAGAKTAGALGTGAAVATGAVQQGADAGSGAYEKLMGLDDALWQANPDYQAEIARGVAPQDAKHAVALALSRQAGIASAVESGALNLLPGARILERAMAGAGGRAGSRLLNAAKGFVGEGLQEGLEEAGGQFAGNVAVQQVDPNQSLSEDVGEAGGLGAAAGPFGAVAGALESPAPETPPRPSGATPNPPRTGEVMPRTPTGTAPEAPTQVDMGQVVEATAAGQVLPVLPAPQKPAGIAARTRLLTDQDTPASNVDARTLRPETIEAAAPPRETITQRATRQVTEAADEARRAAPPASNMETREYEGQEDIEAALPPDGIEVAEMNVEPIDDAGPATIDTAAHEAATSPQNDLPEPTAAQKDAGMDVSIENPAGSKRRPEWPEMKSHYGYLKGTEGYDKDHLDVFIKPGTPDDYAGPVWVVNQNKTDGSFDEHKAMVGFDSEEAARAGYLENYTKGWKGLDSIVEMSMDEFSAWAHDKSDAGPKGGALVPKGDAKGGGEETPAVLPTPTTDRRDDDEDAPARGRRDTAEVKPGPSEKQELADASSRSDTGTPALESEPAPAADEVRAAAAYKRAEKARAAHAKASRINPKEDDLLAAIAKAGGINRDQAEAAGIDPAEFKRKGWRIYRVFTTKGKSLEGMSETLAELGYPVTDEKGYGENAMLDALDRALRGERLMSNEATPDIEPEVYQDPFENYDPQLDDEEYDGLSTGDQQMLLDAMEAARAAGVPDEDIENAVERGAIGGSSNEEIAEAVRELQRARGAEQVPGQPEEQARAEAPAAGQADQVAPVFETYADAEAWVEAESVKAGSKKALLASELYKNVYPQIRAAYDAERATSAEDGMRALSDAGLAVGDRVSTFVPLMFGLGGTTYRGTIVQRKNGPYVKLDTEMDVNVKGRVRTVKSIGWDSRWAKDEEARPALESYTAADIEARDQQKRDAESTRQAADRKAEADAQRDDFLLTDSNRDADEAAARGQDTLFARRARRYPLAPRDEWYGDANYAQTGGRMVEMTPDEYLSAARPIDPTDELTAENVDDLVEHIRNGGVLDPLALYPDGREDGRHRALAAKQLGIKTVPVIDFRDAGDKYARRSGVVDEPGWSDVIETAAGPWFVGRDVSLIPTGVEGAGQWGDGSILLAIDTRTQERLAKVIVGRDGNDIHTIYGLYSDAPRSGAGRRIVEAIVAAAAGPVTVDSIVDDARGFWDKVGAHDYVQGQDGNWNATITGESLARAAPGAGRQGAAGRSRDPARGPGRDGARQPVANKAPVRGLGRGLGRGLSVSGLRDVLVRKLGRRAVKGLEDADTLVITTSTDAALPEDGKQALSAGDDVYGFTSDGRIYLIADNLTDGGPVTVDGQLLEDAYAITLHELGVHHGMPALLGDKLFREVQAFVRAARKGDGNSRLAQAARRAWAQVPESTPAEHVDEEVVAWLVTDRANHDLPLVRRILAAIRAFLVRLGFVKALDADALVYLARGAAMRAAGRTMATARMYARRQNVTDTEAFRKWFEGSKVVDADGKPLVVYHGTKAAGFAVFDRGMENTSSNTGARGFYFTNHILGAETYSSTRERAVVDDSEDFDPRYDGSPGNYEVFLKIENPLVVDFQEGSWDDAPDNTGFGGQTINEIAEYAEDSGFYDGVIAKNVTDEGGFGQGYGWGDTTYIAFRPEQIKSATGNRGTFDPGNPDIRFARREPGTPMEDAPAVEESLWRRARAWLEPWVDSFRYEAQDRFHFLNKAQKAAAAERDLPELPENEDAYLAELRYHGMAGAAIEDFQREHVDPLLEVIQKAGLTIDQVDHYLHARHAKEANAHLQWINPTEEELGDRIEEVDRLAEVARETGDDRRARELEAMSRRLSNHPPFVGDNTALSGMSNEEARMVMAAAREAGHTEALENIAARVDEITAARRRMLVESGLEHRNTIAAWENTYQHYVPLKREGKGKTLPRRGRGYDTRGKEKRRSGSNRAVEHVLANVIAQHEATILRAQKAKVGNAMLEFMTQNPNPNLGEVDRIEYQPVFSADGLVTYRPDPGFVLADNVFVVRRNGQEHRITFNEENADAMRIVKALKNLGAEESGALVNLLSKVTRWLALVNTGANPEFIISNFARDIQTAGYTLSDTEADKLKWKIIGDVGKAWRGIRQFQKGKEGEWAARFDEFRKAGGKTGWLDAYKDIGDREKALADKIRDMERGTGATLKRGFKAIERFIEDENAAVENAIRLSAFVHAREAGISEAKAARLAKELTVNFNRRGNMGPTLNALYLFYNASIQGQARLIGAVARSKKVRYMAAATIATAALLDIWNRAVGDDDDENPYDSEAMRWQKDRNWIVMLPGGDYIKIPLPWGFNVLHVLGQSVGESLTKPDFRPGDAALRVVGATVDAFNPIGGSNSVLQFLAPTVVDPIAQWAENKDWAGRPLRPGANPFGVDKPDSQKYFSSVRPASRATTDFLNSITGGDEVRPGWLDFSPEAFDLLYDTVTGGAGRFVADAIGAPWKGITGEPLESYEVPVLRKLYGRPGYGQAQADYYRNRDAVALSVAQLKHYRGDAEKTAQIRGEHSNEISLQGLMKATEKQLKNLRKQRKAAETRERRKEIEARMEEVMKRFNRAYYERVTRADAAA